MAEDTPDRGYRLYQYFDGRERVWADPFELTAGLYRALDYDPNLALGEARQRQNIAVADRACLKLAAAVREVFGVPDIDRRAGTGLVVEECLDLLYNYLDWLKKKSASGGSTPTSAPPTA